MTGLFSEASGKRQDIYETKNLSLKFSLPDAHMIKYPKGMYDYAFSHAGAPPKASDAFKAPLA